MLCSSVTDVTNWTEKIIEYEQYPFQGNYSNLTRFLWSESDQLQEGNQPSGVISSSTVLSGFYNVIIGEQPSYDSTTPTAPTGAQIVSELNNGYHFYNMYNHGAPTHVLVRCPGNHDTGGGPFYGLFMYDSFNAGYVAETGNGLDNITGENKSTIIYSIGCDNAEFDHAGNPCMAEALITLNNSGGPAFLGNTRFGWIGTSQYLHRSFISRLYDDSPNLFHIGQAEAISKDTYGDHYLAYSHNLFGDPEMAVWTAVPSQFSNVSVTDNVNSITVDAGVSGSTISVCSDDDGSTYYLVADNVTNYTFTTSHRPCFITVTNENYIPYYAITGGSISQDQEWFGHMHILDDVTIPTGKALVISESSTLFFNVGKTMNVNGILNVQGTSSNPVTFTRSGGSGLWAGLKINGTATIDHAIFEYAGQGVSYLNASSGSISNSELRYNNYGIYVNTSLPTIQTCNIHDNNGWGIYICNTNNIGTAGAKTQVLNNLISGNGSYGIDLYNASPSIQNNEIYNQTYGIYGYSNCSPYLGQYEVYGNNNIHDNTYGIGVMNNSNPFLGEENCVVHGGHNQFTANTNCIGSAGLGCLKVIL